MAEVLKNKIEEMTNDEKVMKKIKLCNAPTPYALMVYFVTSEIYYQKATTKTSAFTEAYEQYRHYFEPGSICFQVPKYQQDCLPSPEYHSIEHTKYYHIDWKLFHPHINLYFFECTALGELNEA